MSAVSVLHLLAIDWSILPASIQARARFDESEVFELLRAAHAGSALEVAAVSSAGGLELYAFGDAPEAAVPAFLRALASRKAESRELSAARVKEATGLCAARAVFERATGLGCAEPRSLRGVFEVTAGATLAVEAGTLGGTLAALFNHAANAGWRAARETEFGARGVSAAFRELLEREVERIVEEELLSCQASLLSPRHPAVSTWPEPWTEQGSAVRLRFARGAG